jgi:hypothetical protein
VQHKKQKREKDCETRKEQNFLRCFFLLPPKKRKKYGHRKCRPKDKQATKGQDGHISNLSLSLSLFCVVYASIHSSSSRKKKRYRITRPKKAQRILPPSPSFSQFALSRWCCCFIREREDEESEHPPKEEKQTNKGRVKQKISKSANVAFFSEQERQRF